MHRAVFYRVQTQKRMVALTFDDGPFAGYTPAVLAILRDTGAHATFFVVGVRAMAHPDILRAIVAGGNEVANHTLSHARLTTLLNFEQIQEIHRGADALKKLGVTPVWFRPPYGTISHLGVVDAEAIGERTVLWSYALDHALHQWGRNAVSEMLARIQPGDIILCHDARPTQFRLFRRLIDGLEERGYQVVTVSQLVAATSPA